MRTIKQYRILGSLVVGLFFHGCTNVDIPGTDPLAAEKKGPVLESVTPSVAKTSGGAWVEIKGSGFLPGLSVSIDHQKATSMQLISDSSVKVVVPETIGVQGYVPIEVTNHTESGDVSTVANRLFSYVPTEFSFADAKPILGVSKKASMTLSMELDGSPALVTASKPEDSSMTELSLSTMDLRHPSFQTVQLFTLKENIRCMIHADINDDGEEDLVMGTDAGQVLIFLHDGAGSFSSPQIYSSTKGNVKFLLPGDFNKDGLMDIGVILGNKAATLLNDGKGGFQFTKFNLAGIDILSAVAIDFTQDGFLDILTISAPNQPNLLVSNQDGTFRIPTEIPAIRAAKQWMVLDFDGDKNQDLVAVTSNKQGESQVSMFLQTDKGFVATEPVLLKEPASMLMATDFDGDRNMDLIAVGSQGTMLILLQEKIGTLSSQSFPIQGTVLSLIDLNKDHKPDILVDQSEGKYQSLAVLTNQSK